MKKIILIIIILFITAFILLYSFRWHYRNDTSSVLGKITNSCFNLNRLHIRTNLSNVDIVWSDESEEITIYENSHYTGKKIGNSYGPNGFSVFIDEKKIKSFGFLKTDWKKSYDFYFKITRDTVIFVTNPKLDQLR